MASNGITKYDNAELPELEEVIERGTWEVGAALTAIRERKLYLPKNGGSFNTFETYCRERWGFTDERARQLIEGVAIRERLGKNPTLVGVLPDSERQIRPLQALAPNQQAKAWREVIEISGDEPVTARVVQAVVDRIKPPVRRVPASAKTIDTRVYLCLDSDDAEWSAQEIARSIHGNREFLRELADALDSLLED